MKYLAALLLVPALLGGGCDQVVPHTDLNTTESTRPAFPSDALNFMVIGDWGRQGDDNQLDVAVRMGLESARDGSSFVISTGDNFYETGVDGTGDRLWMTSFEDVYTANSLQVPWYVVAGNHDYAGNVDAQIAYSQQSDRWTFPAPYYSLERELDDGSGVLFVFLETEGLNAHIVQSGESGTPLARQLDWLDQTLTESNAEWKIVIGHRPLYSVGEAHVDNPTLIANLKPVLDRHAVQAYFAGHSHSLQHQQPEGATAYIVSGAGSRIRAVNPNEMTCSAESVPGFVAASLTGDLLTLQFVDMYGDVRYALDIPRDTSGNDPRRRSNGTLRCGA